MSKNKAVVSGPDGLISQRAYARHRKCRVSAVQRAIAEGRLVDSLAKNKAGHMQITDLAAADKEWAAKTGPTASARVTAAKDQRKLPDDQVDFAEAKRRREIEALKVARISSEHQALDIAERRGDLISSSQAVEDIKDDYHRVRTKLLGVPRRCRQRIQRLTSDDVKIIDDLIREALEELAQGD